MFEEPWFDISDEMFRSYSFGPTRSIDIPSPQKIQYDVMRGEARIQNRAGDYFRIPKGWDFLSITKKGVTKVSDVD